MSIIWIISGVLGGILGGMGMGGGTLLIPLLTSLGGVSQHAAQAVNLIAFVPMSVLALIIHSRHRLLKAKGVLPLIIAACISGTVASFVAQELPSAMLRQFFGVFLVILGGVLLGVEFIRIFRGRNSKNKGLAT